MAPGFLILMANVGVIPSDDVILEVIMFFNVPLQVVGGDVEAVALMPS